MAHRVSPHKVIRFRPEWEGLQYCKCFGHTIVNFGDGPACRDCSLNENESILSGLLTKYHNGINAPNGKKYHNVILISESNLIVKTDYLAHINEKYKIVDMCIGNYDKGNGEILYFNKE